MMPSDDAIQRSPSPGRRMVWCVVLLVFGVLSAFLVSIRVALVDHLSVQMVDVPEARDVWRPTFQPAYFQGGVTSRVVIRRGSVWVFQLNDDSWVSRSRTSRSVDELVFEAHLPSWSVLQDRDPIIESFDAIGFDASPRHFVELATGWPRPAFRGGRLSGTDEDFSDGVWILPGRLFDDGLERVIPLRPIPSGLAINSAVGVVVGAMVLLIVRGLRALWCWNRDRRGRCPACGYDRRGLLDGGACPECGAS